MAGKSVRRSVSMSREMADRLALLVSRRPRDTTEADLIREAIRRFLDEQEDLAGSRKYFQKSFQDRISQLEATLNFHLTILTYLLAALQPDEGAHILADAIIAARRDGDTLQAQIKAVREMKR